MHRRFGAFVVVGVCGALALLFSYAFGSAIASFFAGASVRGEIPLWYRGALALMSFGTLSTAFFVLSRLYLLARGVWDAE